MTVHLVDRSRRETYSSNPSAVRELNVQFWYPTEAKTGIHAPYRRPSETTLLSMYQAVTLTQAFEDAAVAAPHGENPVVIFNHAWNGLRTQDTFETIDLASHGFVVASIDHTYNAMRTTFPEGRVIVAQSGDLDDFSRETAERLFERANVELRLESADDSFVLDTLQQWNADPSSAFHGKVDASRVAAIGHSFGGAVAIQAAISDDRVRAAVNMDGWTFGDFTSSGLRKPLLQLFSDEPYPTASELASSDPTVRGKACFDGILLESLQASLQKNGGYLLAWRGTKHMDFSDRPLFSPFHKLTSSGVNDWRETASDIRTYTLRFLQRTLLGSDLPMSVGLSANPRAIDITQWGPAHPEPPLFDGSLGGCGIPQFSKSYSLVQKIN